MQQLIKVSICLIMLFTAGSTSIAQNKTTVDVDAFSAGMQQPQVQLFDVRTAQEFNSGHLQNALQADYTDKPQFAERVKYLDKHKPVYIYCLSGGRSAAAAKWMRENGFQEVVEMQGGINAWKKSGKALTGVKEEKQMSINEYRNAVQGKGWVLVDVGAEWCPPCRKMEPVLQQFLREHGTVRLVKVDGGRDQQVMQDIHASTLPTFIFYRDGQEVKRKEGVMEKAEMDSILK